MEIVGQRRRRSKVLGDTSRGQSTRACRVPKLFDNQDNQSHASVVCVLLSRPWPVFCLSLEMIIWAVDYRELFS